MFKSIKVNWLFIVVLGLLSSCHRPPLESAPQPSKPKTTTQASILPPVVTSSFKDKNKSKENVVIVLDAGHGGEDLGTHSLKKPQYEEKSLNLATTLLVKQLLQQSGYRVLMTRSDDTFVSLEDRSLFANQKQSKLFVSIHYNSAPSSEAEGIEVFYYKNSLDSKRVEQSKALAQCIFDRVIHNTSAKARGVKHGNYSVIRETTMPAVLIEGGFLTNNKELEKIKNPAYQKSLALGISQGIKDYLDTFLARKN